jgi:hypothetical protein
MPTRTSLSGPGPLRLQGDHQAVSFRNMWIRPHK